MSRIDELIAQLCPEGVPFYPMWQLTTWDKRFNAVDRYKQPRIEKYRYLLAKELSPLIVEGGDVKILTTNESDLWTNEELVDGPIHEAEIIAIPWGGNAIVQHYSGRFVTSDNRIAVANDPAKLNLKFLYYFMTNNLGELASFYRGSGIKHPSMAKVLDWLVPVPPPEIQHEIVRILDTFSKMEAELEAELEARKAQHAHYWSSLLTPNERWAETTLGAVAEVFDGPHATPKKTESGPWYLSISSLVDGRFDLSKSAHLSNEEYPQWTRRVEASVGDTMFSYETRLGQAAFWELDEPAALGRRMGILRPDPSKINPRFLTLLYLGPKFQDLIKSKTVGGSTVNRIPIRDMARWPIQIPPLEEQDRLVQALDAFDALVNDLSVGLPAELAARRQQYEYYRDRLLTFKELEPAS